MPVEMVEYCDLLYIDSCKKFHSIVKFDLKMHPLTFILVSTFKVACCEDNHVGTSNSEDGPSGAEGSFIIPNQVFTGCVPCAHSIFHPDAKTCPLTVNHVLKCTHCQDDHVDPSNSAGSSNSAEESFILLNQMVLTGCVPCTLNTPFWCEHVSVDCQTCLISFSLSRWSCVYFKLWSGVRWRREPAWKRQLAVVVPSPTTDLGLADPILSLFEVFKPNLSAVQPKGF